TDSATGSGGGRVLRPHAGSPRRRYVRLALGDGQTAGSSAAPGAGRVIANASTASPDHGRVRPVQRDRKSTRLNSSHVKISYAVFCLKKKTKHTNNYSNCDN